MIKKLLLLILALVASFSLISCNKFNIGDIAYAIVSVTSPKEYATYIDDILDACTEELKPEMREYLNTTNINESAKVIRQREVIGDDTYMGLYRIDTKASEFWVVLCLEYKKNKIIDFSFRTLESVWNYDSILLK